MAPDSHDELAHFKPKDVQLRGMSLSMRLWLSLICYCPLLGLATHNTTLLMIVTAASVGLIFLLLLLRVAIRRYLLRQARVTISADEIVVHGRRLRRRFGLPSFREGWLEAAGSQTLACITTESGVTLACAFGKERNARRLINAAGIDPDVRVLEWRLAGSPSRVPPAIFGLAVGLVAPFVSSPTIALGVVLMSVPAMAFALWRVSRVRVGIDGLVLCAVVRRRFIAYRDIAEVLRSTSDDSVTLKLSQGQRAETIVLTPGAVMTSPERADDFFDLIKSRLDDVRAASEDTAEALNSALDRRQMPLGDWRRRLRELVRGAYRTHAISLDELAAVLENASATPEQRLGAALALAESRAPESAQRLRVAADRCAEPKLRVVLNRVADTDVHTPDDDLERLIDDLEADTRSRGITAERDP